MSAIHTALQAVVKYFNPKKGTTYVNDARISQVQYKLVFGALVTCAILSGLTTWYSRIECTTSEEKLVDKKFIDEWCYANSTFVLDDTQNGFMADSQDSSNSKTPVYLKYYQWVTLALLLQAAGFQIPRLVWKSFEGGRVRKMVKQLADADSAGRIERTRAIQAAANYFGNANRKKNRRHYFSYFALCQCLYLINVLVQICFTESFLDNEFLSLLPALVLGSPSWNRIFPKKGNCIFLLSGATGNAQTMDVVCTLAMNVLFEKLYLLVWALLAIALCAAITQNFIAFKYLVAARSTKANKGSRSLSDALLLDFLKSSMDPVVFRELLLAINRFEAGGV